MKTLLTVLSAALLTLPSAYADCSKKKGGCSGDDPALVTIENCCKKKKGSGGDDPAANFENCCKKKKGSGGDDPAA